MMMDDEFCRSIHQYAWETDYDLTASELAERLGIKTSEVCRHLRQLERAGRVTRRVLWVLSEDEWHRWHQPGEYGPRACEWRGAR